MNDTENVKNLKEETRIQEKTFRASMLTTVDNPYNPFTDFEAWKNFDESKSYFTCNYLARIVRTNDDLSEVDEYLAIEEGIDSIIRHNVLGIYRKVKEP